MEIRLQAKVHSYSNINQIRIHYSALAVGQALTVRQNMECSAEVRLGELTEN
jgi:hypothetical protein